MENYNFFSLRFRAGDNHLRGPRKILSGYLRYLANVQGVSKTEDGDGHDLYIARTLTPTGLVEGSIHLKIDDDEGEVQLRNVRSDLVTTLVSSLRKQKVDFSQTTEVKA
jgi:hypothetical protein